MIDNIIDWVYIAVGLFLLASLVRLVYKILVWFWRKVFGYQLEYIAAEIINDFDKGGESDLAELMGVEREKNRGDDGVAASRIKPHRSRDISFALSYEAYMEFGYRGKTDANLLITRKFMRDLLLEHKDLRAKDASAILDVALHLSFLPSQSLRYISGVVDTNVYYERSQLENNRGWVSWLMWWIPFVGRPRVT